VTSPIVHHPTILHLGPLPVTGLGVAVALGFMIGHVVAHHEFARRGHDPTPLADVLVAAMLGFLVAGAALIARTRPTGPGRPGVLAPGAGA
jgi:prolipoprotein diacylglyceryltransferase